MRQVWLHDMHAMGFFLEFVPISRPWLQVMRRALSMSVTLDMNTISTFPFFMMFT